MEVDSSEKESAVAILLLGCALKLNESKHSWITRATLLKSPVHHSSYELSSAFFDFLTLKFLFFCKFIPINVGVL